MLAAFASSSTGRAFGQTCERYGVDPGSVLDDDVLAFNLRAALAIATTPEETQDPSVRGNPGLYEEMKRMNRGK